MKKWLSVLLILTLCLPGAVCRGETARTFTDDAGREVALPGAVRRILVTGPIAQYAVFAVAPDLLAGLAGEWGEAAREYLPAEAYGIPVIGQLYGGKGEMNLETLLAAEPDVVIDVGEPKSGVREDMDALSEQTGVPFVHIDAELMTFDAAFLRLGELLGREEDATALAAFYGKTRDGIRGIAERVRKKSVLYLLGENGTNVLVRGSYHAQLIDLLCDNVAVSDNPSSKGTGNETDMERIMLWDPEYIIFAPDSAYARAGADGTWLQLDAIRNGRYARVPYGPQNWIGTPPGCQRALGMLWLAKTLYPDEARFDLKEEIREWFRLFCHTELTDEQYEKLIGGDN